MKIRMGLIMGGKSAVVGTIEVHEGDLVEPGQTLLNTETGKGNRPFKSTVSGVITRICVEEGGQVQTGDVLFECTETEAASPETAVRENASPRERKQEYMEADVAIVGAGPGGYVAAIYAARQGLKTVLVEKGQLGGTCLNRGCIPTKALLQSAHIYETVRKAGEFGIDTGDAVPDIRKIFERKDRICGENRRGIQFLLDSRRVTLIEGTAKVSADRTVAVKGAGTDYEIKAGHVILATGSRPSRPPWAQADVCMDSTGALSDACIPDSLVIIGAGVIGMEFAFMYAAYGSRVHVIEYMDHMLGPTDPQAAAVVAKAAREKGIRIDLSSKVVRIVETDTREAVVFYEKDGKEHAAVAGKVLVAVGRVADFDGEAMSGAGIHFDKTGICTDGNMETSVKGIYAIGDVNGRLQLAHAASAQGISVIDHILGEDAGRESADAGHGALGAGYGAGKNRYNRSEGGRSGNSKEKSPVIPSVIFTTPEIASAGKSESQCREEGIAVKTGVFPFSGNGKAKIQGETEGFVKLIMEEESRRLLGGVIVGPDASALISCVTAAITNGLTDRGLAGSIFPHPTTSEAIWEAAMGLSVGCIHYHE